MNVICFNGRLQLTSGISRHQRVDVRHCRFGRCSVSTRPPFYCYTLAWEGSGGHSPSISSQTSIVTFWLAEPVGWLAARTAVPSSRVNSGWRTGPSQGSVKTAQWRFVKTFGRKKLRMTSCGTRQKVTCTLIVDYSLFMQLSKKFQANQRFLKQKEKSVTVCPRSAYLLFKP